MDPAQWAVLVGGLTGGTGVLAILAKGFVKQWNGSYSRERGRNADIVRQRDDAYARVREAELEVWFANQMENYEAREKRRVQEYASALRRDLVELGVPQRDIRPWPPEGTPPARRGDTA